MATPVIQTSFNSGEWAPALNARVDLAKYRSGASLILNYFIDYRGGATTRPGTKYILNSKSTGAARLIPFQASATVSYILEFGEVSGAGYLAFYSNGSAVLNSPKTITNITQANPGVVTSNAHGYNNNDIVYINSVAGMTQVNGNYYRVAGATANTFQLTDLFGNNVNTTTFSAYTSGGTAQSTYAINSPYLASELAQLKYAQNVNTMVLTHPNHPPYALVLTSATSWTLTAITFGSTAAAPSAGLAGGTTAAAGTACYSYVVTSVDANGQESAPSTPVNINNIVLLATGAGASNTVSWTAVTGAVSYNIYGTRPRMGVAVPTGPQYGFMANITGTTFYDTFQTPDFSQGPPIVQNPFQGSGVQSVALTAGGSGYTSSPAMTLTAAPPGGTTATAYCTLGALSLSGFTNYLPASATTLVGTYWTGPNGVVVLVTADTPNPVARVPTAVTVVNSGAVLGSVPSNPVTFVNSTGVQSFTANVTWSVNAVYLLTAGSGYAGAPSVTFTGGGGSGAAATTTLGASSSGNPSVPGFHQQRLFLGGPPGSPSQFNMSQTGAPFNFNTSFPLQPDDALQATLTNTTLNTIQSIVSVSGGLVIIADKGAWLLNSGSQGSPIDATNLVANPQAYSGASALPPIVTPNDILYVQSKGSIVRDLAYNFYLNNYVGADISIISSHLFYSFSLNEWAWAEEPYKVAWAVRNDGVLLSLTFVKEQELIAWTHHDTNGAWKSVATVTENTSVGNVDAVYYIVQRVINGTTVQYIERFVELNYPQGYISSWQVDAGIGYNGAAATTFRGAQHLGGMAVTGVADGTVINFTMPVNGTFTFGPGGTAGLTAIASASVVTVGLAFTPVIGTLTLDLGEPTVQGKQKAVTGVTLRVANTLGLYAGKEADLSDAKSIKDLVIGQVGSLSNEVVSDLQTTDVFITLPPQYDAFGTYYISQPNPYPASILGVIPEITVGDTK